MEVTLQEYMLEKKEINRWLVALIFLAGMFAGVCLMFMFAVAGIL